MNRSFTVLFFVLCMATQAQACAVFDPELQRAYVGACRNGLAEGSGSAAGTAEYRGAFKAGRKHGQGIKTWPNGDRYEGEFVSDRRQGHGVYQFGHGPWSGEQYEGDFFDDRRHGYGIYRWPTGDVYRGPWQKDLAVGPPTPMMRARASFEKEARAALGKLGQKVCRAVRIGIARREWQQGIVVGVAPDEISVQIGADTVNGKAWDWTPCW